MSFSCAAPSTPPRAKAIPVLDSPSLREWQPLISILDSPEPSMSVVDSVEPSSSPCVERVEHADWTNRFSELTWSHWIHIFGNTDTVQETLQEPWSFQDSPRTQHLKAALQSQVFAWSVVHSGASASVDDPMSVVEELEHVDDLTLDEWWNVSVPPTPPSPLSNDILRGQKQLSFQVHENAESESATEDEHVQNQLPSEPSRPCMTISERLRHVRPTIPRTFKYGTCPHHQCALKPHVWGPNSMKRGKAALVCGKFWKVGENQKPLCWYYRPVTVAEVSTWSKYLQQKVFSLQNRFLRAGQNTV